VRNPHQTRILVSLSLNTVEAFFDLAVYGSWIREASWYSEACDHSCLHSLQHCSYVTHTSLALKRTGDAEIGRRPAPEKYIETMPYCDKNSTENCRVDFGRDTRTSTKSRRLVRIQGASWSLNWPSGANLLAHMCYAAQVHSLRTSVTAVYSPVFSNASINKTGLDSSRLN